MKKRLSIPSLQHLARSWFDDPLRISRAYVALANDPPRITYRPLYSATTDLLLFNQPFSDIERGLRRAERREIFQEDFVATMRLVENHFQGIRPDYVQMVTTRYYPIGRGLLVPFTPPVFYGVGGKTYFPWFSFWKRNPLADKRLALFVTLVSEMVADDPDLEDSKFEILDFSAPVGTKIRSLDVIDAADVMLISEAEKIEMLDVFARGFLMAQEEISRRGMREERETQVDPAQGELFGD